MQEDKKLEKNQSRRQGRRSSRVAEQKYFYHKQGLKKKKGQEIETTRVCATIWTSNESSSNARELCCGNEQKLVGYDTFDFDDNVAIASLWVDLATFESSMLCMDLSDTNIDRSSSTVCLNIVSCPPTILSVRAFEDFEASVFVGVPLVIRVELLHATHAVVTWFVDGSAVCHDSETYTPCLEEVGKSISVLVVPVRQHHDGQGSEEAYFFLNKVEPLPFMPLVAPLRESWNGERRSGNHLRVMTYNILADLYAARELDQHVMYNHCPIQFLCRKRRMPMLIFEILFFRPDVVCLQEVDASIFEYLLRPTFESQGYQGYYSNKSSAQLEGCAMFWSLRMFQRLDKSSLRHFHLKDLFSAQRHHLDHWDSLGDIDRLLNANDELSRITKEKVGQVVQVTELKLRSPKSNQPERILVGNTHLFYHPLANHVRTMQAYMICRQMESERERVGYPCPLVICGDFNADPLSGVVQLLSQGRVGPENYDAWRHMEDYHWEMGEEQFLLEHQYIGNEAGCDDPLYEDEAFEDALEDPNDESSQFPQISLPSTFPRLVSGYPEIPEFTNFAVDFVETLDYIFVSQPSTVEPFGFIPFQAAPMPRRTDIEPFLGMPNENMPSDHASLICDLKWGCAF
jgi:mRNA deadenylase 3'-5' endonuclease subunit Ccr4